MPRLFTGLEIPPAIGEILALRRGALTGARWIEPADYHVTLRFLGDVDETVAESLHDGLAEARARPPLDIVLDGIGVFGGAKPRSILATVAGDPALAELHAEHERLARDAGAEPDTRRFTPHVTLARLNRQTSASDVAQYLTESGGFPPLRFTATRVALFSARASMGGGPYLVEAAYPLDG
ncbi:RNA 2',3'-cyclic phosphodiesterase [Methylobacterium sp. WL69]|uniref:RNA 2',3'-cyclic phosphodiesterase n=1 Tax=Methylobacterium sp. WL69 TaxID=2603893 RepID=UPI0011C7759D|nr:RNA 2',3'-cyclic phosphodiesterase [Methylobacterium sp. WL69]TXM77486.1 RNA 2',3'-cyclic phosphodiesterase [Methylobacterium sp. WL69]